MAYILYLAGSLAGVGLMVGLSVLLFGLRAAPLDAADATRRLAQEIAGFRAGDVALDVGGQAALVEDRRDGTVHLVVRRGDGLITRRLNALRRLDRDGAALSLRLSDFTLPRTRLVLPEAGLARAWQVRLAPLVA